MKRSELEKHIGESVEVKLFDGDTMQGVLRKTGTEEVRNNPNLYLKGGYYFLSHKDTYVCKSCLFRVVLSSWRKKTPQRTYWQARQNSISTLHRQVLQRNLILY